MISAKEARELMEKILTEKDKDQLEDISECIQKDLSKGYIYYYDKLTYRVESELIQLGYSISEINSQKDGNYVVIRWDR